MNSLFKQTYNFKNIFVSIYLPLFSSNKLISNENIGVEISLVKFKFICIK